MIFCLSTKNGIAGIQIPAHFLGNSKSSCTTSVDLPATSGCSTFRQKLLHFSVSFCNFSAPRNVMSTESTSKILHKKATQHHANLHVEKMLGLDFAEVGCTNLCLKISTLRTNQFDKHRWVTPENEHFGTGLVQMISHFPGCMDGLWLILSPARFETS